ncbi:putative RbsD/FucU transporter [Colletotrichum sublineola]|uniref:L-fucose mutarotase n=1 Tax=Colletotrichum sublineola TaxID=1173701 RepID=A0A066XGC2_COLSU|nr:putative RbsD/FucU transporter [Colletotrichum sublineola]
MTLKGISPVISPDLLKILAQMGQGDEIVLGDAHFPAHSLCPPHVPILRADGKLNPPPSFPSVSSSPNKDLQKIRDGNPNKEKEKEITKPRQPGITISRLLAGITPLLDLDNSGVPVIMMEPAKDDTYDASVEDDFRFSLKYDGEVQKTDRAAFYGRAKKAYAIVVTGENRKCSSVILKKGASSPYPKRKSNQTSHL